MAAISIEVLPIVKIKIGSASIQSTLMKTIPI
jgi:hypothetical protein